MVMLSKKMVHAEEMKHFLRAKTFKKTNETSLGKLVYVVADFWLLPKLGRLPPGLEIEKR